MINKTEKEKMQNWQGSQVVVSITCVAFNHEYCMNQTLDSFLMQETSFPFEIIVNEDASTDATAEILKSYEDRFPNIVKPVYWKVNQYSQGINVMAILFPLVKGNYVAFCDGDDYWIDKLKLQIQVEEMLKHPEVDMSFHPTYELYENVRSEVSAKHNDQNKVFTPQEIILGGGVFCPTASLMFTSRLITSLPEWFKQADPGDFITQIAGASKAGALYIDRCMSIYRIGVESSWTVSGSIDNSEKRKVGLYRFKHQLDDMNIYLNRKYEKEMNQVIHDANLDFIKTRRIDVSTREEVYKLYKNTFSRKEKILWYFLYRNQNLLNSLKLITNIKDKLFSWI